MSSSASLICALNVISGHPDGITIAKIFGALEQPRSNIVRIINTLIQWASFEGQQKVVKTYVPRAATTI